MAVSLFLSCDWGTSQFRLRLVDSASLEIKGEVCSDEGVARLAATRPRQDRPQVFRQTLAANLTKLADRGLPVPSQCPLFVSGMASSSIGWVELPYASLPFDLNGSDLICKDVGPVHGRETQHPTILISGVRGDEEIMRGEETQVLGLTRLKIGKLLQDEVVVVLPGTHSKHVYISRNQVVDFDTYMTGELFDVLTQHSVLKHSVTSSPSSDEKPAGFTEKARQAFEDGVKAAGSGPLLGQLFRVRARQVLHGKAPEQNLAFLSGLLIGAELAGLIFRKPGGSPVILCGGNLLARPYELAWRALSPKRELHVVASSDVERLCVLGHAVFGDGAFGFRS